MGANVWAAWSISLVMKAVGGWQKSLSGLYYTGLCWKLCKVDLPVVCIFLFFSVKIIYIEIIL